MFGRDMESGYQREEGGEEEVAEEGNKRNVRQSSDWFGEATGKTLRTEWKEGRRQRASGEARGKNNTASI